MLSTSLGVLPWDYTIIKSKNPKETTASGFQEVLLLPSQRLLEGLGLRVQTCVGIFLTTIGSLYNWGDTVDPP